MTLEYPPAEQRKKSFVVFSSITPDNSVSQFQLEKNQEPTGISRPKMIATLAKNAVWKMNMIDGTVAAAMGPEGQKIHKAQDLKTARPEGRKTQGHKDLKAKRPEGHKTRRPHDPQGTRPEDRKTRRPEDPRPQRPEGKKNPKATRPEGRKTRRPTF
ncbi:hypothetical protein BDC45DRAFT_601686 [Circinella umbellata]|nr:hypothetical protein BDC45DRAFT_601686 [Circinella umbellata]